MARINTKIALTEYIKMQLGYPTINVEVTDPQISQIIDDAVQKFTEYAYGTLEDVVQLDLIGVGEYQLPDTITNIIKMSSGGAGSTMNFNSQFGKGNVPNIWSQQYFPTNGSLMGSAVESIVSISAANSIIDKYFNVDVAYNFNHLSKMMKVLENHHGSVALHYQYEYIADDEGDLVFNHEWIKAYTTAKTKFLQGTVCGKFSQNLVGGASINYADMKSEATQEIEILNEQLINKFSDPCPISIA
jgi:hypothetical protein